MHILLQQLLLLLSRIANQKNFFNTFLSMILTVFSNPCIFSRITRSAISSTKLWCSNPRNMDRPSSSAPSRTFTPSEAHLEVANDAVGRYTLRDDEVSEKRGSGVSIVWFRNDLRILDNEALYEAWRSSEAVLPVYCIDPRVFSGSTYYFGFPKTGALRANFILESLFDLRTRLLSRGLNLLIRHGKPEDVLIDVAYGVGAHTIYAHKETCSEEITIERRVSRNLERVKLAVNGPSDSDSLHPKLQLIWGSTTMYHIMDLPFKAESTPDVYTHFRKAVESKCSVRKCLKLPTSLGPLPFGAIEDDKWGEVPIVEQLGLTMMIQDSRGVMQFSGGESAGLARIHEYFWEKNLLQQYKDTRNGMLGPDYSSKFSPWLASGSISPRYIYEEVKRYERERVANNSTYWILFELIWRDYFRFICVKYGNSIFQQGGPRKLKNIQWNQDPMLFKCWQDGQTGYPLIDANMRELAATGYMSNRGRQIVCSFMVRDMGLDWRMGAEWFETCLLDYDPCSNYGNWTYGAGVGNDPREDRYFSIPKQAKTYDPDGEYVAHWLPEIAKLPKQNRHFPGIVYIKPVVPLKYSNYGYISGQSDHKRSQGSDDKNMFKKKNPSKQRGKYY